MKPWLLGLTCVALSVGSIGPASGHVPSIEREDFAWLVPLAIADVTQSIAAYGWLQTPDDVGVDTFRVSESARVFAEVIVPVCPAYEGCLPSYTIVGPGLPAPAEPLRLPPPVGDGAIVVGNLAPGAWAILVWDPHASGGDYVVTSGYVEAFGRAEIRRSLILTPYLRRTAELHTAWP